MKNIRNFVIISHIDHGKSTLADCFLEITGTVPPEKMRPQYLDLMDLERERGITIKMQPVRMLWRPKLIQHDSEYILNLIDTPGHVDFSYEVSRALSAVEGAILLVDATQGIQAQTLANVYLAMEYNLTIIPVVNKIDLSVAQPEKVAEDIEKILGFEKRNILFISAKTGQGVEDLLTVIIERIPPPKDYINKPFRSLIFDSLYDPYKGVIAYVRVFDGEIKVGEKIKLLASGKEAEVLEVGYFVPEFKKRERLSSGEIGYIATGLRGVRDCRVGDTIISQNLKVKGQKTDKEIQSLPGYKEPKPMVFAGIFPVEGSDFLSLKNALEKLVLNDASLTFEPDLSAGLGNGFRCGFLGLLHLEIVKERLEREYGLNLIITNPSVSYKIKTNDEKEIEVANLNKLPNASLIKQILEPWTKVEVITPIKYQGPIMGLIKEKRGIYRETKYLDSERVILICEIPLSEIIIDFYDRLKSKSSGFASLNYEFLEWRPGDLVKMDILVAGERVDEFSQIIPKSKLLVAGRTITKKLKEIIPKALFAIAIQAAVGSKIIARETIPALRKDVTAKLYGGDYTRKKKLLEKQKKGKKKMKKIGKIRIPTDIFIKILKK